jgi:hypothetical protein
MGGAPQPGKGMTRAASVTHYPDHAGKGSAYFGATTMTI